MEVGFPSTMAITARDPGHWGSMGRKREQNLYFQTSSKKGALLRGHSEQLCMENKLCALPYPNLISFMAKRTVLPPTCPRPHLTLPQSFISSSLCMDLQKNWLDLQPLIGPDPCVRHLGSFGQTNNSHPLKITCLVLCRISVSEGWLSNVTFSSSAWGLSSLLVVSPRHFHGSFKSVYR